MFRKNCHNHPVSRISNDTSCLKEVGNIIILIKFIIEISNELRHEKTGFTHIRKQRHRLAVQ